MLIVRRVGAVFLGIAAIVVLFAMAPEKTNSQSAVQAALRDDDSNQSRADGAPQQAVVNGWVARDLLAIMAEQDQPEDNRPAALLTIIALGVALAMATTVDPRGPRVPAGSGQNAFYGYPGSAGSNPSEPWGTTTQTASMISTPEPWSVTRVDESTFALVKTSAKQAFSIRIDVAGATSTSVGSKDSLVDGGVFRFTANSDHIGQPIKLTVTWYENADFSDLRNSWQQTFWPVDVVPYA